jgi:protein involved in polysaccharide export with SLBB domain
MRQFMEPNRIVWMVVTVALLLLFITQGCSGGRPAATANQMASEPPPIETLAPGDVVEVKFFKTPELNESQMVRSDGNVSLQLIGNVKVQGKTPEELRNHLIKLYASQLKQPELVVIVRTKQDRRVFVSGEVNTPGAQDMPGQLTLLEAIKKAGGLKDLTADTSNVLVLRQKNGKYSGCVVNMDNVLKGKEEETFFLQPRDAVYVPTTAITKVNNWVEQYINRMIPRPPSGIGYSF